MEAHVAEVDDELIRAEAERLRADGELLTCEPAEVLPLAQRYSLF